MESTSTNTVFSWSNVKVFLKNLFISCTICSQNPPHQGARSIIKFQIMRWWVRYQEISLEPPMLRISLLEDLYCQTGVWWAIHVYPQICKRQVGKIRCWDWELIIGELPWPKHIWVNTHTLYTLMGSFVQLTYRGRAKYWKRVHHLKLIQLASQVCWLVEKHDHPSSYM